MLPAHKQIPNNDTKREHILVQEEELPLLIGNTYMIALIKSEIRLSWQLRQNLDKFFHMYIYAIRHQIS